MLFTLIPGCSNLSKMTQDTLPPFPKAAHLTVLLRNLLLTFYSTKAENLGQKKKMFTASQLFFYMKTEQLHISLYFGVQDSLLFLHVSFFPCRAIKNSLSKKPEIFLGARSQKNENFNTAHGFAKSNFLLESNWIFFFFFNKESSNPHLGSLLHTDPNLPHKPPFAFNFIWQSSIASTVQ